MSVHVRTLRRRLSWLATQGRHTAQIARQHGLKRAVGDRVAAVLAKSQHAIDEAASAAITRATADAAREHSLAALGAANRATESVEALRAEAAAVTAALQAELAAGAHGRAALRASIEQLEGRQADAYRAVVEGLWYTNAPLPAHPLISVIIPAGHAERASHLRSAMNSVLSQTYTNWELIVVDDGASPLLDPPPSWWPDDGRVSLVRAGQRSVGLARNAGLERARGEVAAYLDDDCRWFPWWLHAVAYIYGSEPDVDVVCGIRLVESFDERPVEALAEPLDDLSVHIVNPVDTNVLTHRTGLREAVWPDSESCTDYELVVGLADRRTRCIPVPAATYGVFAPLRAWEPDRASANLARRREVQRLARRRRPVRVVAHNSLYPLLSETYIGDELAALHHHGYDLVLSRDQPASVVTASRVDAPLFESLADAVEHHDPDMVLMHWTPVAMGHRAWCAEHGVPWAVRYHSFDSRLDPFDLVNDWCVGLYCYPSLGITHPLARHLDTLIADPGPTDVGPRQRQVLSISAGLPKKAWPQLLDATATVGVHLDVVMASTNGFELLPSQVAADIAERQLDATVHANLPYDQGQQLVRQAAAVVYSIVADEPLGQPCSVIEAAIAGTPLVVPEGHAMRDLVGDTAHFYERGSTASLARAIRDALDRPHPVGDRVALANRARHRHCGPDSHAAWADMLTRSLVDWKRARSDEPTSRAQRWWQPV